MEYDFLLKELMVCFADDVDARLPVSRQSEVVTVGSHSVGAWLF